MRASDEAACFLFIVGVVLCLIGFFIGWFFMAVVS